MEFPITDLLSAEESEQWIREYFHPQGLKCPWCQSPVEQANRFRVTRTSKLQVYRCKHCQHIYNLYTNTILQQHHLTPPQVVLLLRGILKGETTNELAAELELNYTRHGHKLRFSVACFAGLKPLAQCMEALRAGTTSRFQPTFTN